MKVAQSCPTLCNPMDYTGHGILQTRILEWVVFPFSRGSSQPRDQTLVSRTADRVFTSWAARSTHALQSPYKSHIPPEFYLAGSVSQMLSSVLCVYVCVCALFVHTQSRVQLFVTPMGCSLLDSSVHGILQARILKRVAISFSRRTSRPRDRTCVSWIFYIGRWVLYHCATWKAFSSTQLRMNPLNSN